MRDRQPTRPGRVKITPENGEAYFAVMEMADEPTDVGTPPTKANLLTDAAEVALFGSAADRTVNDTFIGIGARLKLIMSDMASITVTVKDHAGNFAKDVLVTGVYSDSGMAVFTDDNGVASGYIAEGSQTISVTGYADLEDVSKTLTVVKGSTVTETLTTTRKNFAKFTSSQNTKFSGNVSTIDASVVGAGAGGSAGWGSSKGSVAASGHGGCGGYVTTQDGIQVNPNQSYSVVVGSGGAGGTRSGSTSVNPTSGGTSSAFGLTANGATAGTNSGMGSSQYEAAVGTFGSGNGLGGRGIVANYNTTTREGNAGENGKVPAYISFTETATLGAGGGSGAADDDTNLNDDGGAGGVLGGGQGGGENNSTNRSKNGANAEENTGSGGGGGGAYSGATSDGQESGQGNGGNGAAGVVAVRIHFDFGNLTA